MLWIFCINMQGLVTREAILCRGSVGWWILCDSRGIRCRGNASRKSGGSLKVSRGGRGEHGVSTGFAVIGVSHKSMKSMDILSYADFTDYTDFTEGWMKR